MQRFLPAADVCVHDEPMSDVRIIRAAPEHCEILSALHGEGFAKPWSREEFAALLEQPGVAAWIDENAEPSGFILVRAAADEAEILTLSVRPQQRRLGLGASLLKTACEALSTSGTRQMFLEVSAENTAAIALYRKLGFAARGIRPGYYEGGKESPVADAVIMAKAL